jgi:hypothetical protein
VIPHYTLGLLGRDVVHYLEARVRANEGVHSEELPRSEEQKVFSASKNRFFTTKPQVFNLSGSQKPTANLKF